MPVHWGTFNLSNHTWTEPAEQFVLECKKSAIPYLTTLIGELITPEIQGENTHWWESLKRKD